MKAYKTHPDVYSLLINVDKIVPKERPRAGYLKKNGLFNTKSIIYTPKKTKDFESELKWKIKASLIGYEFPIECEHPIAMHIEFRFAMSNNKSKDMLHCKKPDWDNLGKIVSDALNGLLYKDDKQLWDVRIIKKYNDINKDQIYISWKYSRPEDVGKVMKLSYSK